MKTLFISILFCGTLALYSPRGLHAQAAPFPLQPGEAVASCYGVGVNDPVMGVIDLRDPPPALRGRNWLAPMYHGPNDSWTLGNLGQVFGLALDPSGNIYVTATTSYGAKRFGPGGPGGVYRIDGATGSISVLASLPNTGPGLGNIAYQPEVNQLYVTNFEDGKIYRVDPSGGILSTFDPLQPDNGTSGFAPRGERLWGIATYEGRVYYSVWSVDYGIKANPAALRNEVRSVAFDGGGEFVPASDRHEIWPGELAQHPYSNPIADISFSSGGRMLLAERTMNGEMAPEAHESRLMEYRGVPGNWGNPTIFIVGTSAVYTKNSNAAGGADYGYGFRDTANQDCDSTIWATGDALRFDGYNPDGGHDYVYGLAGMPAAGNSPADVAATSVYIDLNGDTRDVNKRQLGDVAILRPCVILPLIPRSDSLTLCQGDTAMLQARSGQSYSWTPDEGLSCGDCRSPLLHPQATVSYRVQVVSRLDQVVTDTFTVVVNPTLQLQIHVGPVATNGPDETSVPVTLDVPVDQLSITKITMDLTYDGNILWFQGGVLDLPRMLQGTLLAGWSIKATEENPGSFKAELAAPSPAQSLKGMGPLMLLGFKNLLNTADSGAVSIVFHLPGQECLHGNAGWDTIRYTVCGANNRMIVEGDGSYALDQNQPNPFNPSTHITFAIPLDGHTTLTVYNIAGERIAMLVDGEMVPGKYDVLWDATAQPSGLYYYRLTSGGFDLVRSMVLVK